MIRRCAAELIGTFAIVFFGCGAIATHPDSPLLINAVFGLVVAVAIYALGHISAAHFNPAVTIAFAVTRKFPWRSVGPYLLSQFLGAILGSGLGLLVIGPPLQSAHFGATTSLENPVRVILTEAILTFFLMLTIISVATDRQVNTAIPGLAIGMAVAVGGLVAGPLTGSSMNPARSVGPALFAGGPALAQLWTYAVGPVLGAIAGTVAYQWIRGADEHALPAPNDLADALNRIEAQ